MEQPHASLWCCCGNTGSFLWRFDAEGRSVVTVGLGAPTLEQHLVQNHLTGALLGSASCALKGSYSNWHDKLFAGTEGWGPGERL